MTDDKLRIKRLIQPTKRDSIIASKAFHEGDYEGVISLVSQYQNDQELSIATKKILKMAHKYKDKKGEQEH